MDPINEQNLESTADIQSGNIIYETRGTREAAKTYPSLLMYRNLAEVICNEVIQVSDHARQKRIEEANNKINLHQIQINDKSNKLDSSKKQNIENQQNLDQLEEVHSKLPIIISSTLVIILGIALILFYGLTLSSVIGSLVNSGISSENSEEFSPMSNLWQVFVKLPLFLKIISILLSVLPLGIGYLLHIYKQKKDRVSFSAILIFVFLLDTIIAFVVEKQIYTSEALLNDLPPFNEYIKDNILGSFGAIIIIGFGAYFIWGMLLDTMLEHTNPELKKSKLRKQIKINEIEINKIESEISELKTKISDLNQKIVKYNNTNFKILDQESEQKLQKNLAQYTSGWQQFIKIYHGNDKSTASSKIDELHNLKKEVIESFYSKLKIQDQEND